MAYICPASAERAASRLMNGASWLPMMSENSSFSMTMTAMWAGGPPGMLTSGRSALGGLDTGLAAGQSPTSAAAAKTPRPPSQALRRRRRGREAGIGDMIAA